MDNKNRNNNKPGNRNNDNSNNKKSLLYILIAAVIVLIFFSIVVKQLQEGTRVEVTYNKFLSMLDEGKLKEVLIQSDKILFEPKEQPSDVYAITYYTGAINDEQLVSRLEKAVLDKKIDNFKRDNSDT